MSMGKSKNQQISASTATYGQHPVLAQHIRERALLTLEQILQTRFMPNAKNRGLPCKAQYTVILIVRTPQEGPLILDHPLPQRSGQDKWSDGQTRSSSSAHKRTSARLPSMPEDFLGPSPAPHKRSSRRIPSMQAVLAENLFARNRRSSQIQNSQRRTSQTQNTQRGHPAHGHDRTSDLGQIGKGLWMPVVFPVAMATASFTR